MTAMLSFAATVLLLLVLPGPTNSLLAAGGASGRPALRLVAAELGGYSAAMFALIGIFGPWIAHAPELTLALRALAAIWLAFSAVKLWQSGGMSHEHPVEAITPGRVMLTTFLNPKGLIVASLILADGVTSDDGLRLLIFALLISLTSISWYGVGRIIARAGQDQVTPARINRIAAVVLAVFSLILGGTALASLG